MTLIKEPSGSARAESIAIVTTDGEKLFNSKTKISDVSNPTEGTAVLSTGETGGTKFLREDGDGTSSWQAAPSGVWVKISETTPTAISTVDMTWDESLYSAIKVDFEQLETDTDNDAMYMQLGSADGATIHSTTSDYIGRFHVYQAGVSNFPETTQVRMTTAWGNATGEGASGSMDLWSYRGANNGAAFELRTMSKNTGGASQRLLCQGVLTINSSVDTIRFFLGTGAFVATGTIRLYGLTI